MNQETYIKANRLQERIELLKKDLEIVKSSYDVQIFTRPHYETEAVESVVYTKFDYSNPFDDSNNLEFNYLLSVEKRIQDNIEKLTQEFNEL